MSETAAPPNILRRTIARIPEDIRRYAADKMSEGRADAGPGLADKLRHTAPEDRTWEDGVEALVWGMTDFMDGLLTKDMEPSDDGRELDRRGDREFVTPQQEALAENGEIPRAHYIIKLGRETTMKGLRWWGERNGKSLKSLQVNRAKTVIEMGTLAAAHSPLSENEDLMRWGAAAGSGASLTGLIETAFQYMKDDGDDKKSASPQNSTAREVSSGPVGRIVEMLEEFAPGVQPDHLTKIGELLVEASSALAVAKPDKRFITTLGYTIGSLMDVFDGALARLKGVSGIEGMLKDTKADFRQQIAALSALAIIAMRRGNKVAATNYAVAAVAMPLSALTRAHAESMGLVVAEGGLGTRAGRGLLGGIGMGFNDDRDLSDTVSSMLAVSTLNTVQERLHVIRHGSDSPHCVGVKENAKFMREAKIREQAIVPYALAGLAVGAALLAANQNGVVERHMGLSEAPDEQYSTAA